MARSFSRLASLALLNAITIPAPAAATTQTVAVPPPPSAPPAQVSAVPSNAKVKLSWSSVAGAEGYRVFRGSNGAWNPAPIATTTGTTHTSDNLANGTTYSFTVAAYTKGGNGPLSLAVTATPLAPPTGVTAKAGHQRVTLNWQPSAGATSYTVYRKFGSELVFTELATGVVAPPFVDPGLTNGTRYTYQLRAFTADAQSELSAQVSAVAGKNLGGEGPRAVAVSATLVAPPPTSRLASFAPTAARIVSGSGPPSSLMAVQF